MSELSPLLPPGPRPGAACAFLAAGLSPDAKQNNSPQRVPHDRNTHKSGEPAPAAPPAPKLGTFDGVFLPTSLNVLSILMFLRFGFIIGQMGVAGTMLLLVISYLIDILTVLSISAISSNGTVRCGGAYYMILRSLGPEFGVAIGIIFLVGQVLNASLNVLGLVEPFLQNFGAESGSMWPLLPMSPLWQITYSTVLLAACTGVAMVGAAFVSKTAFWLFVVLSASTVSIPVSALFVRPFHPLPPPNNHLWYTGISWDTLRKNMWPHFTSGAAGSQQFAGVPETFRNMFGIFFPATAGVFAGVAMSGELEKLSRSIPKGTLWALLVTFVLYAAVIVSIGCTTPRELLHRDVAVIQTINMHALVVVLGEIATSLFSVIMGIVGAASMLNAISNDKVLPGLAVFAVAHKPDAAVRRAQLYGVTFTWLLAQVFLFADINKIATFITMAISMTFMVTNLACFLLRVGSAPNFRPSFKYFSSKTALTGCVALVIAMYICDGLSATTVIVVFVFLIMAIHYSAPPLKFGDISQLLIYHQVRKYLLRLKLNMSVKNWRPQILLLCDDPCTCWNLIGFFNHLKKGGLYILGHVVIIPDAALDRDAEFGIAAFKEVQRQKRAWVKLRDMARIKAFVHIAIGPSLPWGVRNVFLGSGLGGMKPNITVLGFQDFAKPHGRDDSSQSLPTDNLRKEKQVSIAQWVQIVEDLIIMHATVAVAANFGRMAVPALSRRWFRGLRLCTAKRYIDLYPIQMSTTCVTADGHSVLQTNFDTYTLILQLGAILATVDEWRQNNHVLRIIAFVETKGDEADERLRLEGLLEKLRIDAEVRVVCLNDGHLESYNYIVTGLAPKKDHHALYDRINRTLLNDQWWHNLTEARKIVRNVEVQRARKLNSRSCIIAFSEDFHRLNCISLTPLPDPNPSGSGSSAGHNRRYTLSNLHDRGMAVSLNMRAQGGNFFHNSDSGDCSDDSYSERDTCESSSERSSVHAVDALRVPQLSRTDASALPDARAKPKTASRLKMLARYELTAASCEKLLSRPLKVNLRPNFLAVRIFEARVQDDESAKPSITFVDESDQYPGAGHAEMSLTGLALRAAIRTPAHGLLPPQDWSIPGDNNSVSALYDLAADVNDELRAPSIISVDILHERLQSPHFLSSSDEEDLSGAGTQTPSGRGERAGRPHDLYVAFKKHQRELRDFSFNRLPANGQHLILNELMRHHLSDDTAVIFSTLPAPDIGTHLDPESSSEYANSLAIWLDELPPVVLLNSQTVTVTTAL
ncbi:hypothetical protein METBISCDRAFT_19230 [Metschnikowia bicuspidata]|uniref:Amino acid permease/ SLC12A domain-containing protein n=1 Tax=Metschnikowia bicuspidata TaxID=27322 RepID=A0A4P9Z8Y2_9ASCO|nr:hypothetical protein METBISCDRAFT_19230 [Metschnikowia bicuspidata]